MKTESVYRYDFAEELANAISHGVAGVLSLAAIVLLVTRAVWYAPEEYKISVVAGGAIFGASLFVLYLSSTLYHALLHTSRKDVLLILDHVAIYILIAGSYTFFCLTSLHGPAGFRLLVGVWALAALGIGLFMWYGKKKLGWVSLMLYLVMGWLAVTELSAFWALPAWEFYLILAGGLAYSIGSVFYALQHYRWMHFIWHLFVIAGSALHVAAACCVV